METEKKEKTEKKFGKFDYLGIALLFLGMLIAFWMVTSATQNRRLKKIQQEMSLMISRHKTDSTKLAIASADIAEAKADTVSTTPCLKNNDTVCVKLVPQTKVKKVKHVSTQRKSQKTAKQQQNVTGNFQSAPNQTVSTSIKGGSIEKGLFCVNVHNMDGASFWPQLAIDMGMEVEGAIFNRDHSGHNIAIYPVKEPTGLYGITIDGHAFVRCNLLDQFDPTIIRMSGSFNGWREWIEAEKIGSYYITK